MTKVKHIHILLTLILFVFLLVKTIRSQEDDFKPGDWILYMNVPKGDNLNFIFRGVLISPDWVLTTASCVLGNRTIDIFTGIDINPHQKPITKSKNLIPHPDYTQHKFAQANIGLIEVEDRLTNLPIALIPTALRRHGSMDDTIGIACFSGTKDLFRAEVDEIGKTKCENTRISQNLCRSLQINQFCAITTRYPDTGDTGTPLFLSRYDITVVIGIYSEITSGYPEHGLFSLYTSVFHHRPWIKEISGVKGAYDE